MLGVGCAVPETDASTLVSAGVLSQYSANGTLLILVSFISKDSIAECNSKIYNKDLLAIKQCFEEWRPELEGELISVTSDYKS